MLVWIAATILAVLAFLAPTAAQELKVKEGVQAHLREGPASDARLIRKLTAGDLLNQRGRDQDWIRVEGGWIHVGSVEWTMPLKPRGSPVMRVGSNKVLSGDARGAATSSNGRLLAAMGLADKSQITIFDTDSLQSLTEIAVPAEVEVPDSFELSFIDDNTLLLTNGDRRSGISEVEAPKAQTIIDVNSGQVIRHGAPLFGYLNRNHTDRNGTILSFTRSKIFRHDPSTYEIVDSIDISCIKCESSFERNLHDVQVSPDGIISIAARVGDYNNQYYYTLSSEDGLLYIVDNLSKINIHTDFSKGFTSTNGSYGKMHFNSFLPGNNVVVLWEIPDDNRIRKYGHVYSLFNTETAELIDRFVSPSSLKPLICADDLDIVAPRMELGPDGYPPDLLKLDNLGPYESPFELTSIRVDPSSGRPNITRLAKRGRSFSSGLCLDEGRRAFLGRGKSSREALVVDVRSTPEARPFSLPAAPAGAGRFELMIGDAVILPNSRIVRHDNENYVDLDKLTQIVGSPPPANIRRVRRGAFFGFPGIDGDAVLLGYENNQRGVWFMDEAGEVSQLSDKGARSVWITTVRSTNGAALLVMNGERRLSIVNVASRKLVPVTGLHGLDAYNAEYGDDKYMAEDSKWSIGIGYDLITFDYSGEYLYVQGRDRGALEKVLASSGEKVAEIQSEIACNDSLGRVSQVTSGGLIACLSKTGILIGNIETGRLVTEIETKRSPYRLSFDATGRYLFASDSLATLVYSVASRQLLASLHAIEGLREELGEGRFRLVGPDGWLLLTPDGFYASEGDADKHLRVSYGVERTYPIDKFRDALYRPDLVAEALKGDPEGLVKEAAARVSLEKILQSGTAPDIIIKGEQQGGTVKAEAEIKDAGGGIGRIEWRVNGVVQETDEGKTSDIAELFLAGGDNRIELVAYNRDNTIQGRSEALAFTVADDKASSPRLFVLTVGVDDYSLDQLKLKYAARDAEAVATAFEKAGAGLYGEVFVEALKDQEVTRANLEAKFRELAESVRPNDVLVFFSAGHGKTLDGRFFFIPQDFSGTTLTSIREQGIGHATWQEWFSLIPAQKSLLLFDSCESGALTETVVGRELRFRAANDFLGNATGRALIAASSGTGVALEGYKDQGVFAWSVIDALSHADRDANGLIDIDELAVSIEETVPRIAEEAFGEKQTPQFKAPMKGFDVVRPIERQ